MLDTWLMPHLNDVGNQAKETGLSHHYYNVIIASIGFTGLYLINGSLIRWHYGKKGKDSWINVNSMFDLRSRWMTSFTSTLIFLLGFIIILGPSMIAACYGGRLYDWFFETGWADSPAILVGTLFVSRCFYDHFMGIELLFLLHHLACELVALTLMCIPPYRDTHAGLHCVYLFIMELGSISFNVYPLWPCEATRNVYFWSMSISNLLSAPLYWLVLTITPMKSHPVPTILMIVIGNVFNLFRQSKCFAVCGWPGTPRTWMEAIGEHSMRSMKSVKESFEAIGESMTESLEAIGEHSRRTMDALRESMEVRRRSMEAFGESSMESMEESIKDSMEAMAKNSCQMTEAIRDSMSACRELSLRYVEAMAIRSRQSMEAIGRSREAIKERCYDSMEAIKESMESMREHSRRCMEEIGESMEVYMRDMIPEKSRRRVITESMETVVEHSRRSMEVLSECLGTLRKRSWDTISSQKRPAS